MPKVVLTANAIEVSHNKEAFCIVFRCQAPDGHQESVYIFISPAGARTTQNLISKEIEAFERETRQAVAPWETPSIPAQMRTPISYILPPFSVLGCDYVKIASANTKNIPQ